MDKKGGIFVLYNYARMTNLLNKFDDAVASGELWFFGCVSHTGSINKCTKIRIQFRKKFLLLISVTVHVQGSTARCQ